MAIYDKIHNNKYYKRNIDNRRMTKEQNEIEVKKVLMEIKIKRVIIPLVAIIIIALMAMLIWKIISNPVYIAFVIFFGSCFMGIIAIYNYMFR